MTAKIIAGVLTLLIDIAAAVIALFMMLIAMNGYSESDATPGLIVFLVLAVGTSVLMAVLAFLLSGRFIKKEMSALLAALIAVPITSIAGILVIVVSCFIGVGVAEYVRVHY